jgi:general secretion pathway protein L
LAAVTAAHLAHAPKVNRAIEQRQTAELLRARLAAVARLESESLPWTPTVAALATTLPDSAYLITLSAEGLKLRLAGIAASASAVVPALESSPLLREVSLTTARRRQGAAAGEDFDLDLALRPLSALVPAAGPQTGRPQ